MFLFNSKLYAFEASGEGAWTKLDDLPNGTSRTALENLRSSCWGCNVFSIYNSTRVAVRFICIMPSMIEDARSTAPHIPAWKRLGLKLKYARELPTPSEDSSKDEPTTRLQKRKLHDEDGLSQLEPGNSHKKRKAQKQSSPTLSHPVNESDTGNVEDASTEGNTLSTPPAKRSTKRKKSVAFTPETKVEDGDSTKQLFYAWVAEQVAKDPSFDTKALGPAFKSLESQSELTSHTNEEADRPRKKKAKQPKKAKRQVVPRVSLPEIEVNVHPAISYLQQYHQSRETWKFNKTKQTYILKNLFDNDKIPSSLDTALTSYIQGLQGTDARSRVRQAALTIRAEDSTPKEPTGEATDVDKMEDPTLQKTYYDRALHHYLAELKGQVKEKQDLETELDPEWQRKFLKRKRAERILWSMGELETNPNGVNGTAVPATQHGALPSVDRADAGSGSEKMMKVNDGTARRRRKRRTGVPDDDDDESSSNSSSSSDSESGSDSDAAGSSSGTSNTESTSEEGTSSESEDGSDTSGSSSSSSSSSRASSSSSSSSTSASDSDSESGASDSAESSGSSN